MPAVSSAAGSCASSHGASTVPASESVGRYSSASGVPTTTAAHVQAATGNDRSSPGISCTSIR
jgi:hypothetical protein